MPRQSRIDAPGALQHVIARGIERRKIFQDDTDRKKFVERFSSILKNTQTNCFAWALLPNHFHLLLRTGQIPISTLMRRLLTGYAVNYNRRHRRHGHLFQNRYKSILCQEDRYLLELVRYIHLNPIRAKIVGGMHSLDKFLFTGHSVIMGKCRNDWQDTEYVLQFFGNTTSRARRNYRSYVVEGISLGKRDDLMGGGLIRSAGGWANVKAMRKENTFQHSDERILGDGNFVERVLSETQEQFERRYELEAQGFDLSRVAQRVSDLLAIETSEIWKPGKNRRRVKAKSLLCYWASRELEISMTELSRKLHMSPAAISLSVKRGEKLALENNFKLI